MTRVLSFSNKKARPRPAYVINFKLWLLKADGKPGVPFVHKVFVLH